jgi:hypothetical protein
MKQFIMIFVLGLSLAACAEKSIGQTQEQKSKPASKPAPSGMLLVICDLSCYWSVDGETNGRLDAGRSARLKVMPGEHIITAASEDGVDQVQQITSVKGGMQKLVNIELYPLRFARIEGQREAAAEAARVEQQRQEQEQLARKQELEAADGVWTDPDTGLMWARTDLGQVSWHYAAGYCQTVRLAGHNDWRLPTYQELRGIYEYSGKGGWHVKGNLHMSGWHWSSTTERSENDPFLLDFDDGYGQSAFRDTLLGRVLCVRNQN